MLPLYLPPHICRFPEEPNTPYEYFNEILTSRSIGLSLYFQVVKRASAQQTDDKVNVNMDEVFRSKNILKYSCNLFTAALQNMSTLFEVKASTNNIIQLC